MRFAASIIFALLMGTQQGWTKEAFRTMNVKDLAAQMKASPKTTFIYDANGEETRKLEGIIPGAKLLASSSDYSVEKELPADKANSALVFYCANEQCTASHTAAKKALKAGYKNVSVMTEGIQGWKKAGMKLESWTPPTSMNGI